MDGTVAPAVAAERGRPASTAPQPRPPSPEARVAAKIVQAFVEDRDRPVHPGLNSPADVFGAFSRAEAEYFDEFPFEAAFAQWDCRLDGHEEQLVPASDSGPDEFFRFAWANCGGGYQPSGEETATVRLEALASERATDRAGSPNACQTIAGGSHCLSFSPGHVHAAYTWLGSLMHGRIRLGNASVPWPSCNSGSTEATSSVVTLGTNGYIAADHPTNRSANWSLTFDEANSAGQITGVRSVFCQTG
jgi:hypothetical protein